MEQETEQRLCREVTRLLAVNAVQNIISTTSYMYAIGEYNAIVNVFFSRRPDISAAYADEPRQIGHDAVWKLLVTDWEAYAAANARQLAALYPQDPAGEGRNGLLDLRALASPVIEVAGDAQTAKGLWLIPGTQTCAEENAGPAAHWNWTKLAVDFVREDDKWKIWHYWTVPCLYTSYHQSWTEHEGGAGQRRNPYSCHGSYPHPPRPPKPYQTFSETFSY